MKQKVIQHLDQYRDKSLSFGCEVEVQEEIGVLSGYFYKNWYATFPERNIPPQHMSEKMAENWKVIGHPLTHADLLRALREHLGKPAKLNLLQGRLEWGDSGVYLDLPLTYRTIEDIPEDDPMWGQLSNIFNPK